MQSEQAQTLFMCNSSKSRKAALKTVGSEFSWVTDSPTSAFIQTKRLHTYTKKNTF